jgi:hypothetical protein
MWSNVEPTSAGSYSRFGVGDPGPGETVIAQSGSVRGTVTPDSRFATYWDNGSKTVATVALLVIVDGKVQIWTSSG